MKRPGPPETSPFKHQAAEDSAGFLLWKITSLWQGRLSTVLSAFKITQTQYAILASLLWFEKQKQTITQSLLVEHANLDKMTLSKAIRNLEKLGFLTREKSMADSRAWNVRFTQEGLEMTKQAIVAIETADDEFFSALSEEHLAQYKALTQRVIKEAERPGR